MKREYIGLRLSAYELARLREIGKRMGAANKCEAMRLLIRAADMPGLPAIDLAKCTDGPREVRHG